MASYCAKRRVFHVPIIPCFCHFATLIPHFSANLHLCIFPNIPANAAFSFVLPESDLRDIATDVPASAAFSFKVLTSDLRDIAPDVPASAAFSFQRYHKRSAWHCPPMFRQAPLFGQKSVKRCNAAYWASRAAHLSRRVSLFLFCSPIKQKPHYLMLQISKNYTGNSSIIFDNSGFSGVNAGSHYIFCPKVTKMGTLSVLASLCRLLQ